MSTVQQLLTKIDAMYTNAIDTTNKVEYMNMAQDDLTPYFGLVVVDETLDTLAEQDEYTYPTGIEDISQIEYLDIGNQATPDDRYDYQKFVCAPKNDDSRLYNSYRQGYDNVGVKSLIFYPVPETSGYPIRIRYHKRLTPLSPVLLTASPEFDSTYHDLLALYACYMICSTSANPDYSQADRFMQAYESGVNTYWKKDLEASVANPSKPRDNRHWRTKR